MYVINCAFLRSMLALGLSLGFGFNFFCCIGKEVGKRRNCVLGLDVFSCCCFGVSFLSLKHETRESTEHYSTDSRIRERYEYV